MPVHNAAAFLTACTDAIAAQKFDDFRCILVDDGSTDDSAALCDAICGGRRSGLWRMHQPNSGVCAARTAGLRRARELGAEWYRVLRRGRSVPPCVSGHACMRRCTRQRPAAGLLPVRYLYRRPARRAPRALPTVRSAATAPRIWTRCCMTTPWTTACGTSCSPPTLLTPAMLDNNLAYNEDLLANWQCVFAPRPACAFCDWPGYHYRQHADSASRRGLPPQSHR